MGKNVVIGLLAIALVVVSLRYVSACGFLIEDRAAHFVLRRASNNIWQGACQKAAAGDRRRLDYCVAAAKETKLTVAEDATPEGLRALAVDYVVKQHP